MIEKVLSLDPMQRIFVVLLLVVLSRSVVVLTAYGLVMLFDKLPDNVVVSESDDPTPRPATYQVLPGDTLWAISKALYPGHDPREIVYEIRRINGLASATIHPYEVLKLPEM